MLGLSAGIAVFLLVGFVFWRALPSGEQKYRFADTPWEPYIGVALTAGLALGFALILSSVIHLMGS
jgi:hypothetical protein